MVALREDEPSWISVAMQLASPATVQRDPVKPLVQTQEQTSPLETLTPPFSHGELDPHSDLLARLVMRLFLC